MDDLFALLLLASLACLVVGLIRPRTFSFLLPGEATRRKVGFVFGLACWVFFIAFGVVSDAGKTKERRDAPAEAGIPEPPPPVATIAYTFDVPSLLGKDIDGIRLALGPPKDRDIEPSEEQLRLGASDWSNGYDKDGKEMLVTFDPRTRRVIDFFLSGEDKEDLLRAANVREGEATYAIEPVRAFKNPAAITGIKIIPVVAATASALSPPAQPPMSVYATPAQPLPAQPSAGADATVYITDSGMKYHRAGCRHLKSVYPTTVSQARAQGYEPCKVCNPTQ